MSEENRKESTGEKKCFKIGEDLLEELKKNPNMQYFMTLKYNPDKDMFETTWIEISDFVLRMIEAGIKSIHWNVETKVN